MYEFLFLYQSDVAKFDDNDLRDKELYSRFHKRELIEKICTEFKVGLNLKFFNG